MLNDIFWLLIGAGWGFIFTHSYFKQKELKQNVTSKMFDFANLFDDDEEDFDYQYETTHTDLFHVGDTVTKFANATEGNNLIPIGTSGVIVGINSEGYLIEYNNGYSGFGKDEWLTKFTVCPFKVGDKVTDKSDIPSNSKVNTVVSFTGMPEYDKLNFLCASEGLVTDNGWCWISDLTLAKPVKKTSKPTKTTKQAKVKKTSRKTKKPLTKKR